MKDLLTFIRESLINEGGNSIESASPIPGDKALPVAKEIISVISKKFNCKCAPLGSTGKKRKDQESGDIDIALELDWDKHSEVVDFVKTASSLNVNLDFISGIPSYLYNHTSKGWGTTDDLNALFSALQQNNVKFPEHLSVYLLSIEDGTALKKTNDRIVNSLKNMSDVINKEDDRLSDELVKTWDFLKKNNYNHYEVSAFSKKGKECKHNRVYWSLGNYIGLGSTASSHSVTGFDITSPSDYISYALSPLFSTYQIEKCSNYDIAVELLLTALRTTNGISSCVFNSATHLSLDRIVQAASKKCSVVHNVADYYKNGVLALPEDELLFSDYYIDLLSEIVLNYNQQEISQSE